VEWSGAFAAAASAISSDAGISPGSRKHVVSRSLETMGLMMWKTIHSHLHSHLHLLQFALAIRTCDRYNSHLRQVQFALALAQHTHLPLLSHLHLHSHLHLRQVHSHLRRQCIYKARTRLGFCFI
jgi:hypothetical protein